MPRLNFSRLLVAIACVLCVGASALAQQAIQVVGRLSNDRPYAGEPVDLQIRVEGSRLVEAPSFPEVNGLEARYLGGGDETKSSVTIINGRMTEQRFEAYNLQFRIVAPNPGRYTIPAIEVKVAGNVYRTEPLTLEAMPPQQDPEVFARIQVDQPMPYVGESIRLRFTLGLARDVQGLDISLPGIEGRFDFVNEPPPLTQTGSLILSFLDADLLSEQGRETIGNRNYTTYTVERIIRARDPGPVTIGPGAATVELIVGKKMATFGRAQLRRAVIPIDAISVNVRSLPTEGRPPNFNGAVGRVSLSTSATPREINVGDPIVLTLRIEGPSAFAVPPPALDQQPSFSELFRAMSDDAPENFAGGARILKRTIRPLREGIEAIPPIEIPYFDLESQTYKVARSEPIPIEVRRARIVTSADGESAPGVRAEPSATGLEERAGGIRSNVEGPIVLRNDAFDLVDALRSLPGIVIVLAPPALGAAAVVLVTLKKRSQRLAPGARKRRALAEALGSIASASSDPAAIASAMRRYAASKCDRPHDALTSVESASLVRARASEQTSRAFASLLDRCDAAHYGGLAQSDPATLREEARALLQRLDSELGAAS